MRNLIIIALCLILAACQKPAIQDSKSYPAEITGVGELGDFPITAAGYTRGKMIMYEPDMKNYSIAYNIFDSSIQNSVTLYFYESPLEITQLFEAEKQVITAHPGAKIIGESVTTVEKAGTTYKAYTAAFTFNVNYPQGGQAVFSQLLIVSTPKHYFKVRSTAPLAQAEIAITKMQELLGVVDWAH